MQMIFKENVKTALTNNYTKSFKGIDNILEGIETFDFYNKLEETNVSLSIENQDHNNKERYEDCMYRNYFAINGEVLEKNIRTLCEQFVKNVVYKIDYDSQICSVSATINVKQYKGRRGEDKNNGNVTLSLSILEPHDRFFSTIANYVLTINFCEITKDFNFLN